METVSYPQVNFNSQPLTMGPQSEAPAFNLFNSEAFSPETTAANVQAVQADFAAYAEALKVSGESVFTKPTSFGDLEAVMSNAYNHLFKTDIGGTLSADELKQKANAVLEQRGVNTESYYNRLNSISANHAIAVAKIYPSVGIQVDTKVIASLEKARIETLAGIVNTVMSKLKEVKVIEPKQILLPNEVYSFVKRFQHEMGKLIHQISLNRGANAYNNLADRMAAS